MLNASLVGDCSSLSSSEKGYDGSRADTAENAYASSRNNMFTMLECRFRRAVLFQQRQPRLCNVMANVNRTVPAWSHRRDQTELLVARYSRDRDFA